MSPPATPAFFSLSPAPFQAGLYEAIPFFPPQFPSIQD